MKAKKQWNFVVGEAAVLLVAWIVTSTTVAFATINDTAKVVVSHNPTTADFTKDPDANKDRIIVRDKKKIVGTSGMVLDDPVNDGAEVTALKDSYKEGEYWKTKFDVEGRGGIGAVYKVYGGYKGSGGSSSIAGTGGGWWSKAKDKESSEVLVLKDMFQAEWVPWRPDVKTDVADGGPPPPFWLWAHAARNNNLGSVRFWISKPTEGATYNWWIKKISDNSVVQKYNDEGKAPLSNANNYTFTAQNLAIERYYLLVEKQGGDCTRRIDFLVYRIELVDTRPNPDNEVAYDEILGQVAGGGITSVPAMPQLKVRFLPDIGERLYMQLGIQYNRPNRDDNDLYPDFNLPPEPTGQWLNWSAHYVGTDIRGGKAYFKVFMDPLGAYMCERHVFHIRGQNPTEAVAKARLVANGPWFAYAIAKRESGTQNGRTYLQFNDAGTVGKDFRTQYKYLPNREGVAEDAPKVGWGMMQLTDPKPSAQHLWSWTANVDQGISFINNQCIGTVNTTESAVKWIARQERQQKRDDPNKPLENEMFTWRNVPFKKGTTKTPIDACAIQRYRGVPESVGWIIVWRIATKKWEGKGQDGAPEHDAADYLKDVLDKMDS